MRTVFVDGSAGTTGLRIVQRLAARADLELLTLPESLRKDPAARKELLNRCDVAFLCLPDGAAIEAAGLVENDHTVVLDTSTAHRTDPDWVYGFPELGADLWDRLPAARRIAVPGCHASGFLALVRPLVLSGILPPDARLTCHSVTGYSGGGKSMIAQYEAPERAPLLNAPRQYGLAQTHKHLKEMRAMGGLTRMPVFCPIVADFYSGMAVTVPLFREDLVPGKTMEDVRDVLKHWYQGPVVRYLDQMDENGFLSAAALSGTDGMEISVSGNEDRILLLARYDNLGKGASGAAVQCLNLVLGCEMTKSLEL